MATTTERVATASIATDALDGGVEPRSARSSAKPTTAANELMRKEGYYDKNPGTDVAYLQMTRTEPTDNSKGLRLGNMIEIRNIIQEELEKAFQGQQNAQHALDNAVQRGNTVLRAFERANQS